MERRCIPARMGITWSQTQRKQIFFCGRKLPFDWNFSSARASCLVCREEIELGIPEPLGLGLACLGWLVQVKKPMTSAREVHTRPQFALGKKGSCLAQLWFNTFTFNLVDLVQEAVILSIQLLEETQLLSFCSMSSLVDVYSFGKVQTFLERYAKLLSYGTVTVTYTTLA